MCREDKQSKVQDISRNYRESVKSDPDERSTKISVQNRMDPRVGAGDDLRSADVALIFHSQWPIH